MRKFKFKPSPEAIALHGKTIIAIQNAGGMRAWIIDGPEGIKPCRIALYLISGKGGVICQFWEDGGCTTYADWPMGETFDHLREFLIGGAK